MVGGTEDEDQDDSLIQTQEKHFPDVEGFPDGRDFKFNTFSQASVLHNFEFGRTNKFRRIFN